MLKQAAIYLWESASSGGTGGNPFTDLAALGTDGQTQIIQAESVATVLTMRTGSRVDNVQLTLSTGPLPAHGGSGGNVQTLNLQPGEYLQSANVWVNEDEGGMRL
jgi:hypothetical protein